jgi:hypothetical protein
MKTALCHPAKGDNFGLENEGHWYWTKVLDQSIGGVRG